MLKGMVEYKPLRVGEYEMRYETQQLKYLQKKAAKQGDQIVPEYPGDEKGGLVGRPPYL